MHTAGLIFYILVLIIFGSILVISGIEFFNHWKIKKALLNNDLEKALSICERRFISPYSEDMINAWIKNKDKIKSYTYEVKI